MSTNLTPEQRRRMHKAARNFWQQWERAGRILAHRLNSISRYNRKVRRAVARGNRIQAAYYHLRHLQRVYKGIK